MKRLEILNIWVDMVGRETALECARCFLKSQRPHSIFAANPEKNFSIPMDPLVYETFKQADLLIPDGIGMVWAARLLYGVKLERVPGSEFIFDLCRLAQDKGHGVYFFGAKENVNRRSVEILKRRFPKLNVVGRSNGYFADSELPKIIGSINDSGAEILFLALGSPRQEKWFAAYKNQLRYIKICQGIGGTLDTIGGEVKRAAKPWRDLNLEWLFRLIDNPKRIRRQIVLPVFVFRVLYERIQTGVKRMDRN